jgi:pimeloyl-ACP methyl ester carboxylesterase
MLPHHETMLLPAAGHFLTEDAPVDVAAAIRRWYANLSGAASMPGSGTVP